MKTNVLTAAIAAGIAVQAMATAPERPHIAPQMTLRPTANAENSYDLLIYGDIGDSWYGESVTARSVVDQLHALDASVTTINVLINSYGGAVADGLAIYNALKRHKATKAVTIDGVAMSSASLIAMAGDTVTMPPTSILMIHAPWGGVWGNSKELRQYADVLDQFSAAMADAYVSKSGMDRDDVLSLLTDGIDHYYTGEEAIAAGFADAVADVPDDDSVDDTAQNFASAMFARMARGCPSNYHRLAVAAALRGAHPETPTPPAPAPVAAKPAPATAADVPQPAAAAPGTTTEETVMTPEEILAADKQRRDAIRARFAPFLGKGRADEAALLDLRQQCEDNHATTADAAGNQLLAQLATGIEPLGAAGRVEAGTQDETVNYREGAVQAIVARAFPSEATDERARAFRGFDLSDMARDAVERAGIRTRGLSKAEIAVRAMQSTSDFPNILENIVTKTLRRGYESSPRTFTPFSRQATLPNFKQVSRSQLSGAPNLKRVLEGAEYEFGTMDDGAEKYSVQKYGRIVAITWETVINDDLDALTRIPFAFGASAADLECDIVYAIFTGNPVMADTVQLFHGTHGNLGTNGSLLDEINPDTAVAKPISEMRKLMLLQKGREGRYIAVRPRYLIVPPSLEGPAIKVTTGVSAARPIDQNVFGPSLQVITEPRLEDSSSTAWFAAADPGTIDTIEYAYLQGHEGVFTETRSGFEVDGVQIKCRHVFGAKAIDHRGLFKNAGAAPAAWPGTGE